MRTLLVLLTSIALLGTQSVTAADTLTIVHLNDTHSNLAPGGRRDANLKGTLGGIARAASFIGYVKQTQPNVMVVHGGDLSIGDLFYQKYFGVAELQMLGAMGLDVMTPGNHEFDLTPAVLLQAYGAAFAAGQPYPIVSANLNLEATEVQPLKTYITPNTVKTVGNIKVGVFGMTTPETNLLSQPSPAFVDTNIVQIAMTQIASLKAQGCDVIIMMSHLGSSIDVLLSQVLSDVDLIVGAHSHEVLNAADLQTPIPIVQAGAFYHHAGVVQLEVSDEVRLLASMVMTLDENVPEEPTIGRMVTDMIIDIEETYGPVYTMKIADATADIEQLAVNLEEDGSHATPLGNLICDAFLAWGGTDIAVEPGGSVAQNLYQGPLVAADAFRAISYGFNLKNGLGYRMARFSVLGAELMAGLEFGLADLSHDEFLVQVGGMRYTYDPDQPPTQRLTSVVVGTEPIDPMKRYTVTANEFVVMFFNVLGITPQDIAVNEDTTEFMALAGYIGALQSVSPNTDARVSAGRTSSVLEGASPNFNWFSTQAVDNMARVYIPNPMVDGCAVELYTTDLCRINIPFSAEPTDQGMNVTAYLNGLGSGVYIMKIQSGDQMHLGRILVAH